MSFSAQFEPADVERVYANRHTYPAGETLAGQTVYFIRADLRNGDSVTLDTDDPATMRVLLNSMLAALDTIDPAHGDQERVSVPERYRAPAPWTTTDSTEAIEGGEAA